MHRREFLRTGLIGAGVVGLGGLHWGRTAYARNQLITTLKASASSKLLAKEHEELGTLPASAREEIRTWFHGVCLNSAEYVRHICSDTFAERLAACANPQDQEWCLLNAFVARVVSEDAILSRVHLIAEEAGAVLDRNWASSAEEIAAKWNICLSPHSAPPIGDLSHRLSPLIDKQLKTAIQQARAAGSRPALGETVAGIGQSAVLLLPLIELPPAAGVAVGMPLFALLAFSSVFEYVLGQLNNRVGDYQNAISDRVAYLGNRVGAELESEIRSRVAELHAWQAQAVRIAAEEYANETVTLL